MKLAVFSEADMDELAVRILIEGLLGKSTSPVNFPIKARGWPSPKNELPAIIKHLYYRTDAEALVVVADADNSPLHERQHEESNQPNQDCRFCAMQMVAKLTLQRLPVLSNRAELKVAVGLAIPTIEAWLLCGNDPRGAEAAWHQSDAAKQGATYRKILKTVLYGSEISPQQKRNQIARDADTRLAQDINLLETHFPIGFRPLAEAIRNW